jgi:hypothetical protein
MCRCTMDATTTELLGKKSALLVESREWLFTARLTASALQVAAAARPDRTGWKEGRCGEREYRGLGDEGEGCA